MGFILRILAGCFAISVLPSPLVILMTFFMSMFFTFTKRRLELKLLKNNERHSLHGLNEKEINQFVIMNAVLSVSFYITYMLDKTTIERAGTEYLYITVIPFTLIIYRLLFLVDTKIENDDPMYFFKNDKTLLSFIVFYLFILSCILCY